MKELLPAIALLSATVLIRNHYINALVSEPYLDEVFHIPQALAYCRNAFAIWDPKLTTPAGLYLLSYPLSYFSACNTSSLRAVNGVGIALFLPLLTYRIRQALHDTPGTAAHTALNTTLFPLVYFFGGLYYTDVWSAVFVLAGYLAVLKRRPWLAGVYCCVSMGFRQTNLLWAVFLAGVWVVEKLKARSTKPLDISVGKAGAVDYITTPFALVLAAVGDPLYTMQAALPFVPAVAAFAGFLVWNKFTIVLGDASAHVAALHTPQLLYFTAFTAFFSFPLYLRYLPALLPPSLRTLALLPPVAALIAASVKFNTLLHPYLLADNRHYTFYIFSKIIRPLPWWVPVPVYAIAGMLQYWTMDVSVSWVLLWGGATAAGLVTAPLVEPRYFVVAWLLWRCNVKAGAGERWVETVWFAVVNAVTTWVFLEKGFEWASEPGNVQRFMW